MVHHLYITGIIDENTPSYVVEMLNSFNLKKGDFVRVHIHSPGGYVNHGYATHDILVARESQIGFTLETFIEGDCKSIATVIALSAKKQNRYITSNSDFMIHNPWGEVSGDSSVMARAAKELRDEELKLANFYADKTGKEVKDILKWMKVETTYNAQEAIDMGFATNKANTMKAVALTKDFTNINKSKMSLLEQFKAKIKALTGTKALDATLEDGTAIYIETESDMYAVGDVVTIAETGELVPDATHTLSDGMQIVTVAGVITEIIDPSTDQVAALEAEIVALKAELTEAKALIEQAQPILDAAMAMAKIETKAFKKNPEIKTRTNTALGNKNDKKNAQFTAKDLRERAKGKTA